MSKCERCHKEFESTRKDKKFCSELCRKRAEKARYQKRNRSAWSTKTGGGRGVRFLRGWL